MPFYGNTNKRPVGRPKKYPTPEARKQADAKRINAWKREKRQREKQASHFRTRFTGDQEWYTPARYIDAVRDVLGTIDLDPASSPEAQQTVRATRFYTAEDHGLTQAWQGRVFMNPPYAQPLIEQFITRLIAEVHAGHVTEAILLTHNYSDTAWFHQAEAAAQRLCFTKGRIRFRRADGVRDSPTNGQVFFYFGADPSRFVEVFSALGFIR
jgi:phage N-6-adenine-methyltransferase